MPRRGSDDEAYRETDGDRFWTRTPGVGTAEWVNDKNAAESWYERHEPATAAFRRRLYAREVRQHAANLTHVDAANRLLIAS